MTDPILLTALVLTPVALVVLAFALTGRRFRRALSGAAGSLGLTWRAHGPFSPGEATGTVDGEHVDIYVTTRGAGSFQRILTVVEVDLVPPLPAEFEVGRENILTRLGHTVGLHDEEFGDPAFDGVYRVHGPDHAALARLFDADARAAMVALARRASDLSVTPSRIRWERSGRVLDAGVLIRTVREGVAVAKALRRSAA